MGCESDNSSPPSAEIKNEYRATRLGLHGLDRDNFTFAQSI